MRRLIMHALLAACTLAIAGCATSVFDTTWTSPDAKPLHLRGRKVAAVFVSRDPMMRRIAEDAMAREITARGAIGVAAYTFLSDEDVRDRDLARAKAEELGCGAAAVMRVVGHETIYRRDPPVAVWVAPPYRRMWGGYWGWGWQTVWEPDYLHQEQVVKIETLLYSLDEDDLVWAGVSRTFEPLRMETLVREIASEVSHEMARAGLTRRD